MDKPLSVKAARVLKALGREQELTRQEMPLYIGHKTLMNMVANGLIERVPNGAGPYSENARWRRKQGA